MTGGEKRNILFIMTDQQRFDTLGCNGNPHIQTPHLDRLAARSLNLQNHTCSTPICTPARASLLSGQYGRSHGAFHVGYTLDPATPLLTRSLGEAGYRTGFFGKSHLEPELSSFVEKLDPAQPYYGFEEHHITEDNVIGPYMDWIRAEHPEHAEGALMQANEQCHDPSMYGYENGLKAVKTSTVPEELHQTGWIADHTIDFIQARREDQQPFLAWCSFVDPHHPWVPPEPFASSYDPATLPVPEKRPSDAAGVKPGYFYQPQMTDADFQAMMAAYYAMISHIDHHVGRVLDSLEAAGLADNTIIVFTSDHGDYNGDHGYIRKSSWHYDSILHVPLLVHVPGSPQNGQISNIPTQHEDIMPTLLDLLDLPLPETVQGGTFAPSLRGHATEGARHYAFYENARMHFGRVYGVAAGPWKLLIYPDARRTVLTNRDADPMEYDNLAGQTATAEIEAELRHALLEWLLHTPHHRPAKVFGW